MMTYVSVASFPPLAPDVKLSAVPSAVPLARRLLTEALRHWSLPPSLTDDAGLVISELVTNAIAAAETMRRNSQSPHVPAAMVRFRAWWQAPELFIQVWDPSPLLPIRRIAADGDETGRGMVIIEALAETWDAYICTDGGKVVWVRLRLGA